METISPDRRRATRYRTHFTAYRMVEGDSPHQHYLIDISATGLAYADWLLEAQPGDIVELMINSVRFVVQVVRVASEGRIGAEIVETNVPRFREMLEQLALINDPTKVTTRPFQA